MTREIALHCMKSDSELHSNLCELCPIYGQTGSDHCFEDALQYVIKVLEQEPCEDCISREDAINQCGFGMTSLLIAGCLRRLPSVTPQPFINEPCVSEGVCREDKIQVLDKIRAEIKGWQVDIHDNENDADKHDFVFERIFEIIDENKAESEDKE